MSVRVDTQPNSLLHFFSHICLSVKELLKAPWHHGEARSLKEPKSTMYQRWESGPLNLFGPWVRHVNQRGSNLQLQDCREEECGGTQHKTTAC